MSPRPRKVSDEAVFAAAYRAMQRLGPGELTLADIASEAGVTAGALIQRFGSKRALLLALAEGAAASAGELLRGMRTENPSPLATLRAYSECLAGLASSPTALARSLAYLQVDLTDPEFRAQLALQGRATRHEIAMLLHDAVRDGELQPGTDADTLARTIEVVLNGALFTWAFYQDGTAREFVRESLDGALRPFATAP